MNLDRILITGASGFIGTNLTWELANEGHTVIGVDREDGDLTCPEVFRNHLAKYKPTTVVHLAAQVGRLFGEDNVQHTVKSNALMTTFVARSCSLNGIDVVYASTSEVYGDYGDEWVDETAPLRQSHNLYGMTKKWGEEVCQLYVPPEHLLMLRFSMPYGPGVMPGRGRAAILNMLWQAHTGQPITVHKGAERSWTWIGDTTRAVRLLMEGSCTGPYNVGRADHLSRCSMLQVANKACSIAKADHCLIEEVDPPNAQTLVKRLSNDRLRRDTGWEPTVELDEGMKRLYEWVKEVT